MKKQIYQEKWYSDICIYEKKFKMGNKNLLVCEKTCNIVQMLFTSVSPGPSEFGNKLYSPALNN